MMAIGEIARSDKRLVAEMFAHVETPDGSTHLSLCDWQKIQFEKRNLNIMAAKTRLDASQLAHTELCLAYTAGGVGQRFLFSEIAEGGQECVILISIPKGNRAVHFGVTFG
ncbi:hypothetical protein [Pseudooceanicola sp. MF1-13]|uniref:hypothetical protein n=1 Tax=Pseudooceanicola sp. MF1-13 TaxID=3379095 RepID=UPI003892898B